MLGRTPRCRLLWQPASRLAQHITRNEFNMTTTISDEYVVSPRVTLSPGDIFRANKGPLWRCSDGTKISIAAKGPFKFVRACKRGVTEWIEAIDKSGSFCVLHVRGRRRKISDQAINRPYVIQGKKRRKKLTRDGLADSVDTTTNSQRRAKHVSKKKASRRVRKEASRKSREG
jgi:hypothetical protein